MEAGAVSELLGIARFKFREGKVEEYKRLSAQAMEIVRTKDSGTLQFDSYLNDDESECMVIERYRDFAAASSTGRTFATCPKPSLQRSSWFTARSSAR
jgi:quinol monooxygenase YgiN